MTVEKSKRKQRGYLGLTRYFKQTLPFDFIAAHTLEECVECLEMQSTQRGFYKNIQNPTIDITVSPIDSNIYQFSVRYKVYREANITVLGTIERVSESSTLVTGTIAQYEFVWLYIPFIAGFLCLFWPAAPFIIIWYVLRRYYYYVDALNFIKSSVNVAPE